MTRLKSFLVAVGVLVALASPAIAQSGCGGQFPANQFCGTGGAQGLPGPRLIPAGGTTPINGGTVLGNPTAISAVPIATPNPVLGIPGSVVGTLGFANGVSGTVTIQTVGGALGTQFVFLPDATGTMAVNASTPIVLNNTTGLLTCPTCVTSSGGGAITGATPIAVSGAGVVSINAPYGSLTASNGGIVYSGVTNLAILNGTATARQMLQSGASGAPAWSTATWPATTAAGTLLASGSANTVTATATPVLGVPGSLQGTLGFAGVTSGTATITAQGAAGSPTLTLPNASGTFAVNASSPLVLSATTGALTCPTCVTGTSGALTAGTTPTSGYTNTQILGSTGSALSAYSVNGTGNVVLTTSPTLITPALGVATGTSLALSPTALSNNPGLTISQSTPTSGSIAGPNVLNLFTVIDGAQTVTGSTLDSWGQITNQTDVLRFNYRVTGGTANHFGVNVAVDITGSNGGTVPLISSCQVNVGTVSVPTTGDCWANIAIGNVGPSGNLNQSMIGYEAEMVIQDTGVGRDLIGFSANSQGPTVATRYHEAYSISTSNQGLPHFMTGVPWPVGIHANSGLYGAGFPIAATGSFILIDTGTVANLISAHTLTVTGNVIDLPSVNITGPGTMILGTGSAATSNVIQVKCSTCGIAQFSVSANGTAGVNSAFMADSSGNNVAVASAFEAASTLVKFGQTTGNWVQFAAAGSTNAGILIGTNTSVPVIIGTNNTARITIGGTGGTTIVGGITAASLATPSSNIAGSLCQTSAGVVLYNVGANCFAGGSSGTVTSITAGAGLSGGTITASGTISLSPPYLEVYLAANQSVTDGTFTLVAFDTVLKDTNSWWNATTHLYTPQLAGTYEVTVKVRGTVATAATIVIPDIRKNATSATTGYWARSGGAPQVGGGQTADSIVTAFVTVNGTTDTIEAYGFMQGTGGSDVLNGQALTASGGLVTYMEIKYVGP